MPCAMMTTDTQYVLPCRRGVPHAAAACQATIHLVAAMRCTREASQAPPPHPRACIHRGGLCCFPPRGRPGQAKARTPSEGARTRRGKIGKGARCSACSPFLSLSWLCSLWLPAPRGMAWIAMHSHTVTLRNSSNKLRVKAKGARLFAERERGRDAPRGSSWTSLSCTTNKACIAILVCRPAPHLSKRVARRWAGGPLLVFPRPVPHGRALDVDQGAPLLFRACRGCNRGGQGTYKHTDRCGGRQRWWWRQRQRQHICLRQVHRPV